ncbi:hypothetical protein IscW_ISCW010439 [Ixodes scapularis]|uniref:Uncharacterized protein n=1 Tax=Ixodes scapularis TaxID=6945 RepID=B7Q9Q5_IXOSC|nr:hypothetical protein IscW_ISCW010439 [Ixodes scapularis]|eukprot:XP_002406262.1 hypothetical protein IscW_ISCW010439 [Ixodes scapularis]
MEAEDAELTAYVLQSDALPGTKQQRQLPHADGNGGNEAATSSPVPKGGAPSPVVTSPEARAPPSPIFTLPAKKTQSVVDMYENSVSAKRGLDKPLRLAGMTPRPSSTGRSTG